MENDTMSLQKAKNCHQSPRSSHTSKATPSKSGGPEWAKKNRIKYQQEQAEEVQNFILLWNLISQIRQDFSPKM